MNNAKNLPGYLLYACWLLIPSLALSMTFMLPLFCIDVLAFAFLEQRLAPRARHVLRLLWSGIFVVLVLSWWNIPPESYMFYLNLAGEIPVSLLGFAALLSATFAVFVFAPVRAPGGARGTQVMLLACVVLLIAKLGINWKFNETRARYSPIVAVAPSAAMMVWNNSSVAAPGKNETTSDATFLRYVSEQPVLPGKLILLMIESWGESQASLVQISARLAANNVTIVDSGFTSYQGSTLQGEFRELCAEMIELKTPSFTQSARGKCAPQVLRNKQYDVIGLHGYKKGFYARSLIWKNLGISETYFAEDLPSLKLCNGRFAGVCDAALIGHGIDLMAQRDKAFLYMLTLSSHEPVRAELAIADPRYLGNLASHSASQVLARNALTALVAKLASSPKSGCVTAYVAGDHQPPSLALTAALDTPGKVPYLILRFNCQPGDA